MDERRFGTRVVLPDDAFATASLLALVAAAGYVTFSTRTPKALGFAVLTLAAFFLQVADGLFFGGGYGRELAFVSPAFRDGEWWRAFSYMFVHAGPFHLFGNLFMLATAGPLLEDRLGPRRWVVLYLLGGALSVLSHMLFYWDSPVAAVGASGAVFAVLGALAVIAPNARVPVPLLLIFWFPAWVAALIFVALNVGYAFQTGSGVAWYGHFAGMAVGIVVGAALHRRFRREKVPHRFVKPEALEPLATTPRSRQALERLRAIRGETPDDAVWADAWLSRFLGEATCPVCGTTGLERDGAALRCRAARHPVPLATR